LQSESEIMVLEDRHGRAECRVEYFDDDGACYVTIFASPAAGQRARDCHAALVTGVLRRVIQPTKATDHELQKYGNFTRY